MQLTIRANIEIVHLYNTTACIDENPANNNNILHIEPFHLMIAVQPNDSDFFFEGGFSSKSYKQIDRENILPTFEN